MSEKIVSNELVYFTGSKKKISDFSGGESCFSLPQRFAFLKQYGEKAAQWYEDADLNQKAASEQEVSDFLKRYTKAETYVRKVIHFDKMTAFTVKKASEYKDFQLYLGACIKGNEIILADKNVRPNPCVKYELPKPANKLKVSFDIFVDKAYKSTDEKRCGQEQAGRSVEVRTKTLDIVKIKIFNTGEAYSLSENMWSPKYTYLGNICFNAYNHVEIDIGEKVFITLNGSRSSEIKRTAEGSADNIFFDGGMHPRGIWKIKNPAIDDVPIPFRKNAKSYEEVLTDGRDVELPYAIGGYENRDKRLYLTKCFETGEFENAILHLDSLDPCGKVWINDSLVLNTENFMPEDIDISAVLKKGRNEIKILVEPRPPEVYYYWHRHTDCYNGWFCGRVSITLTKGRYVKDMAVKTECVSGAVKASVKLVLDQIFFGTAEFFISKCYPERSEETRIGKINLCSDEVAFSFEGEYELWSPESPALYCIRTVLYDEDGKKTDDFIVETGFRTIEQKDGGIYLNQKKILLNGALLMQFLPPFDEVPINHNCPTDRQIAEQMLMLKNMNGNTIRIHSLGYGTNDPRFAEICDRLGVMLVWVTRLIDSIESVVWEGAWQEKEFYQKSMKTVLNNPSVIMWEGSNEYHPKSLAVVDKIYDEFTKAVRSIDDTRLMSPCSHLYYGGGIYDLGLKYYNDAGTLDESGNLHEASAGWMDERVVRSAHTYGLLCGYGAPWTEMRKQNWKWQQEMLDSRAHSYLITEYAVTALANPNTAEARQNPYIESYERPDEEGVFGRWFTQEEWRESQAYQAFCAFNAVKTMRLLGIDGMLWCCLMSGANNGSYLKPPIDFYGYKKLGFYALKDAYRSLYACKGDIDVSYASGEEIGSVLFNSSQEGMYRLDITVSDEKGKVVDTKRYDSISIKASDGVIRLKGWKPKWSAAGHYTLKYELEKQNQGGSKNE